MCNKNSPLDIQTMKKKTKKIQKESTKDSASPSSSFSSSSSSSSLKPLRRRNRTKTRKPKYLSLRLQLSKNQQPAKKTTIQQQPQLDVPENTVESERDIMQEENNVALLFTSDGGATLTGLLEDESTTTTTRTASASEEEGCYSALTCHSWLVRKAMRKSSRNEEGSEERWVCYSEVVEKKEMMEEVTSTDPLFWVGGGVTTSFGLLSLKLDHEGILNAWSDKGSLYVAPQDEAPQLVPNLQDAALPPYVPWEGWGNDAVGNTWKVPEHEMTVKEEMGWKLGQREASVLRYKEKRQSRLFAKRIRYEVRKLNAEKRPRIKGRFVKRE